MLVHTVIPSRRAKNGAANAAQGGGGGGDPAVLDTLTITNDDGGTLAANFVTVDGFALAFAEGDVPSGFYPKLETSGGTAVPATWSNFTKWPDASLMTCYGYLRSPSSIAGSGTLVLNIKGDGSAPSASGFTNANLNASAGRDIKLTVTGFENLSGDYTSSLNTGITDNDWLYTDCDGDAGLGKIIHQALNNGSDHAHLVVRWHVVAHKDASAGVYGWSVCPLVMQPWMNTASPARRAMTIQVLDGSTEYPAANAFTNPKTATYAGTSGRLTVTGHGRSNGEAFKMTTTGALFTGLNTTTVYFAKVIDANTIEVWDSPFAVETGSEGAVVAFTSAGGSGTQTLTNVAAIEHHGGFYGAQADGKWLYIEGTGTRPNIRIAQSKAYLKSTRLFPPFDTTLTPAAPGTVSYAPNTAANTRRFIGAAGGSDTIGLLPAWNARHFNLRSAVSERVCRVNGLATGHIPIWILDETTKQPPVIDGGTYTGLPTSSDSVRFDGAPTNANNAGVNNPASNWHFFSSFDTSHNCAAPYYEYLVFGGPIYRDIIQQHAAMASLGRYTGESLTGGTTLTGEGRKITISGTTYDGVGLFFSASLERVDAWTIRAMFGGFLLPDTHPDGTQITQYCRHLATNSCDAFTAYRATRSQAWKDYGVWEFCTRADGQGSPWAKGFLTQALTWGACISKDADAIIAADHFLNWYTAMAANLGVFHANSYIYNIRNTATENILTNVITDPTLWTFEADTCSTNAGADTITAQSILNAPVIAANTRIAFSSKRDTVPGGLTSQVIYYARDVVNNGDTTFTFKVAATPGGAAIDLTDSISSIYYIGYESAGAGPSGTDGIGPVENYEDGYTGLHRATILHGIAYGKTGLTTARSQIDTIMGNASFDFVTNPKHALTDSFT